MGTGRTRETVYGDHTISWAVTSTSPCELVAGLFPLSPVTNVRTATSGSSMVVKGHQRLQLMPPKEARQLRVRLKEKLRLLTESVFDRKKRCSEEQYKV
jgi:hypothetical protein